MSEKEIIQAADKDFDIEAVDMRDDLDFYNVYRAGVIYGQNHPNILKKDKNMIKEGLKKILPVMQAFVEGKTIQRYDEKKDDWYDVSPNANIDFYYNYRIKPATDEDIESINKREQKEELIAFIRRNVWSNLSLESLQTICDVVKKEIDNSVKNN